MALFWLSVVLFLGIAIPAVYFAWRYRYKPGRVTPHVTHNTALEIVWSVLPLLLCVGIFFWGLKGWMEYAVAPGEAMEIQVTAKKWLWQFEYPDGSRTRATAARADQQAGQIHHDQRRRDPRFLRAGHARQARHHSRAVIPKNGSRRR